MILYDFEKLWLLAMGNSELIVKAFKRLVNGESGYEHLKGQDFIVNPRVVTHNTHNLTNQQLAEYLGILAMRPLHYYYQDGYIDLDMTRVPSWVPASIVKSNPLIKIKQAKLKFIQEIKLCQD